MIASRTLVALSLLVASSTFAAHARAADAAAAEALFNEARRLMSQGNFKSACPQLEESQKLDPGMGTLYNLGDCYEKTGRVASAWAAFLDVAAQARTAGQAARESDARARATALEPKLSRLTIAVEGPAANTPGLQIKRGATEVGKAQWGLALPIDPGEHTVEVTAPGKRPLSTQVQIAGNAANARFDVPALEDAPNAPAPLGSVAPGAPAPTPPAGAESAEGGDPGKTQRTTGLIVGGVGVIGLGVGAAFGLMAMGKKSDADKLCIDNRCTAEGLNLQEDGLGNGRLSTTFFVAGGLAAAAGVVLFVTAPKNKNPSSTTAAMSPLALPGGGGLSFHGSFR